MASEYNEGGTDEFVIGSCVHFCESCARRDDRIADLQRQLAEKTSEAKDMRSHYEWALAEIEAMRPVVDAARYHERSVTFYSHGTSSDPYHCDVCRAYKVYEARKQP